MPTPTSSPARGAATGNTQTIARNTLWYGVEIVTNILTAFVASIVIARAIGPQKLGYFNYIMWLANISAALACLGVPASTRKYMAEYFGRGQPGISRAVYQSTLKLQMTTAGLITAVGLILVFTVSDRQYWSSSLFLVASMFPGMLTSIPAGANIAAEDMGANVPSSLVSSLTYIVAVALSLVYGWGLPGIALGFFLGRSAEVFLRLRTVRRWIRVLPLEPLPEALRTRMRSFSGLSTVLMILQIVVWDRSDMILLKMCSSSIKEVTFYSIAINLMEKTLLLPQAFGGAVGTSVMAQFGRDREALRRLVARASRYMFLCGLPLILGLALLSAPFVETIYGPHYLPVIPVLFWVAFLAIPKTMLQSVQQLLLATEQQRFLVMWISLCGVVNIALDLLLIPSHGALGAAIGNGVGQALAVMGMWYRAIRHLRIDLPWRELGQIGACGLAMSVAVSLTIHFSHGWIALAAGIIVGGFTFIAGLRLLRIFTDEDRSRVLQLTRKTPRPVQLCVNRFLFALTVPEGVQR
jgi:O-antigen/teichoic acid export membrane protein